MKKSILYLVLGAVVLLMLPGCNLVAASSLPIVAAAAVGLALMGAVRGVFRWLLWGIGLAYLTLYQLPSFVAGLISKSNSSTDPQAY